MNATGGQLIAANATGCLEVFSTPYPESSWQMPWLHSLFANAPSVATGIAAALKVKGREDVRVVGQAGDGGTVDIGMACLSGMFERNDDVLFICYDNEAYMNTGVQRSGATPPAARTMTTQTVRGHPGNVFGQGKDMARIAMAHEIPYVATATVVRTARHRGQGRAGDGAARRALPAHPRDLPARLGLRRVGLHPRGAARQGDGPVPGDRGRARRGDRRLEDPQPDARSRSTSSCRAATATSSSPSATRACSRSIQARADRNIERYGLVVMEKPFAITLEVGSSLANKTGAWRDQRPVYVDRLPPCNHACPAGENIQAWLYEAEDGGLRARLAHDHARQPLPRDRWAGSAYHPCTTACNRAEVDEAVGINNVERFLGDAAIEHGWKPDAARRGDRQADPHRRRRARPA